MFLMPGRKNKPFKVREQLDDSFLRRSHRLSLKTEGFKDAKSAREASSVKSPKTSKSSSKKKAKKSSRKSAAEAEEPVPLAIIPPGGFIVAPHLSKEILLGIGEGFLQIQPESVSATLLRQDDIDD